MRIGFDAKRAFMNATGLGVYSRTVITWVTKVYPVVLFTPKRRIPFIDSSQQIEIIQPSAFLPNWTSSIWRFFCIGRILNRTDIDIYHGLSAELPFGVKSTTKKVVTIHDLLFERFPRDYPYFDRQFARWKARYACVQADRIIAVSEATKSDIVNFYKINSSKIEVIPVPIEFKRLINETKPPDTPYIVCVSSFISRKNQLLLIQAFERISKSVSFNLVFIGRGGAYYQTCLDAVQNSSLSDRIQILNDVDDHAVRNYYHHALFSVYPSLYEGFGIPIVESIGYHCPILASDNATHREVGGGSINYFENNNLESLERELYHMYENQMSIRTKQLADRDRLIARYSPEQISQKIIGLYTALLED